jgi:hypothetical protein
LSEEIGIQEGRIVLNLLLGIDDTDNHDSIGTGQLAGFLAGQLAEVCRAECSAVTRHQLFVHPDIPYTSHNSAMCFTARVQSSDYDRLLETAAGFLRTNGAQGSDPGLCVVRLGSLKDSRSLISFGRAAKERLVNKDEAYTLASRLKVHLSEHGGTGDGVVGALAGTGLRLSGNDGRFRGWTSFEVEDQVLSVGQLCDRGGYEAVQTETGRELAPEETLRLVPRVKAVLLRGRCVVLAERSSDSGGPDWQILPKERLKRY